MNTTALVVSGLAAIWSLGLVGCSSSDDTALPTAHVNLDAAADGNKGIDGAMSLDSGHNTEELCGNGLDDNQNGAVDEGCACKAGSQQPCFLGFAALAGKGVCKFGVQKCLANGTGEFASLRWGPCEGSGAPAKEACDGIDNDCNGTIDNGCSCNAGETKDCSTACGQGMQSCVAGQWGTCSATQASAEQCDGKDNNCDGQVDEALTKPCSTACGEGTQACLAGQWGACSAQQPKAEVCNDGVDNDCNGQVDEVCVCEEGSTQACSRLCGAGTQTCKNSKWGPCSAPQPSPEICDGKDNNCNGQIDESVTQDCSVGCALGVKQCVNGTWGSCSAVQTVEETCGDGVDNNCNGQIDEGCPPVACATFSCNNVCCNSGAACCSDNSCPVNGQCPGGDAGAGLSCEATPILFVLDRSNSMAHKPNGDLPQLANIHKTKWARVLDAITTIVQQHSSVPFGLELFPQSETKCQTLPDLLASQDPHENTNCGAGEVLLDPVASPYQPITTILTRDNTPLCHTTPTQGALELAFTTLAQSKYDYAPTKYVILVTDGQPNCGYTGNSVAAAIQQASASIHTFVLGFDGAGSAGPLAGVGIQALSKWACAGREPANPTYCSNGTYVGNGDPAQATFYFARNNEGDDLLPNLSAILSTICHP